MREPSEKELVHERLGERNLEALSLYDTLRRVETLVDSFLGREKVMGRTVLDVGCGYGWFSERLAGLGANVTACDIGPGLVESTSRRVGCAGRVADALCLEETFGAGSFDAVVSSECIEHTPDPGRALAQMAALLKPGGWLAVSTPNRAWYPAVWLSTALRVRPYAGHENFSTFGSIRRTLEASRMEVVREHGLHLWPFQLPLHGASRWTDDHAQFARGLMINVCVLARKQG